LVGPHTDSQYDELSWKEVEQEVQFEYEPPLQLPQEAWQIVHTPSELL
jgi:hypothetical protein